MEDQPRNSAGAEESSVLLDRAGEVATITLNRPESLNAIDEKMMAQLNSALLTAGDDEQCAVIVLTANGRAFCTGKDMKAGLDNRSMERKLRRSRTVFNAVRTMRDVPQPVIAAVQGYAVGAGFALAVASDLRIVGPDAKFKAVFAEVGMTPGDLGLSYFLPRIIGAGRAAQLFYRAGTIDAQQAQDWGLAAEIASDPRIRAHELARELAELPSESLRQTKELLETSASASTYRDHLLLELRSQVICAETNSHHEAMATFVQRRSR